MPYQFSEERWNRPKTSSRTVSTVASASSPASGAALSAKVAASLDRTLETQFPAAPFVASTVASSGPSCWRSVRARSSSSWDQPSEATATSPSESLGNCTGFAASTFGDSCTASSVSAPVTSLHPGPCSAGGSMCAQSSRASGVYPL